MELSTITIKPLNIYIEHNFVNYHLSVCCQSWTYSSGSLLSILNW